MEDLLEKMQEILSDPESRKQVSELAQMLQTDTPTEKNPSDNFDPTLLLKVGELLKQPQKDKNTELLLALRPHLREERQKRLDTALKLLKLWHIWKTLQSAGLLQNLLSSQE